MSIVLMNGKEYATVSDAVENAQSGTEIFVIPDAVAKMQVAKMRCKTCAHWFIERNDYGHVLTNIHNFCSNPDKLKFGYNIPIEEIPLDGALIENDEGWGIMTGPEFGCIHWKGR